MAALTLAQAQATLAEYLAAESAVLRRKRYSIGGREMTFEDLDKIRAGRKEWEAKVNALENGGTGGMRVRGLTLG